MTALRTKDELLHLGTMPMDSLGHPKPAPIDIKHSKLEKLDDTALRYGWYIFVQVHVGGRVRLEHGNVR
jgi:hypothetical protein